MTLNLKIDLERTDIFEAPSLPIYKSGLALHVFRFSLISFNNVIPFPVKNSCTGFLKSIPGYAMLLGDCNGQILKILVKGNNVLVNYFAKCKT